MRAAVEADDVLSRMRRIIADSVIGHGLAATGSKLAAVWQEAGRAERLMADRMQVTGAECDFADVAALARKSLIVRVLKEVTQRGGRAFESSKVAKTWRVAAVGLRALSPWQRTRLIGVVLSAALAIHVLLLVALPGHARPVLPPMAWTAVVLVAVVLVGASRKVAAAWANWIS